MIVIWWRDAITYSWAPPEPSAFILLCYLCGSARILCRFQKYIHHLDYMPPPPLLSAPLCSVDPYVEGSPWSSLHWSPLDLESRRWVLGIDFRFEDFADLILRWDYSLRLIPCRVWVWILSSVWRRSSGVEEMLSSCVTVKAPPGVTAGNNHVQILTHKRREREEKHTGCDLFCTCFLFLLFWLFWFMMKYDGCFNKDTLSLFWE